MIPVIQDRYLDQHQARRRQPTTYEDLLGDSIERAFGAGHWELDALLAYLNKAGPLAPNSQPWTAESYQSVMKTLATGE
ncbi:MAG: hypothetical protein EOP39_23125 [Rubrivivax sp.]|nr:MAG: hypothetical protein EOP39_23125 [Rubrivivax sp.]